MVYENKKLAQTAVRPYIVAFLVLAWPIITHAQNCITPPNTISNKKALQESIAADPAKKLVKLQDAIPGLKLDIRYATKNNFTSTVLYKHPIVCLRAGPAEALKKVQEELNKKGLAIKIYDAFRPFSVTCKIWRLATDRHYVANPAKGSNHNRALALDLTLIDMKSGKELEMGTGYDNFTDTARHGFPYISPQAIANRQLLKSVMRKYGFGHVPAEWWHYQWHNDRNYEVIDLDFDDLVF